MTIRLHRGDLPNLNGYKGAVAIDTETMGLDPNRDRLCVVQLSPGDGSADVVQIAAGRVLVLVDADEATHARLEQPLAEAGATRLAYEAHAELT